jgi:hypothetical protein
MTDETTAPACELLDVIDLKWLLAGDGHRVHVERLLTEADYARSCLVWANASPKPATRAAAQRIARNMGVALPPTDVPGTQSS